MNSQSISALKKILSTPQKISLVTHRNPDGDAIGSSLAMQHYLKSKGHTVQTVLPNEAPAFLQWLPGAETTLKFDKQNQQSKKAILESNILFILDFNALHRVGGSHAGSFGKLYGNFCDDRPPPATGTGIRVCLFRHVHLRDLSDGVSLY